MTSIHAKPIIPDPEPLTVLFLVYPDIVLLDLVGPLQVFTHARKSAHGAPAYDTHIVSMTGGRVETNTILAIDVGCMKDWLGVPIHTLVIVGGDGAYPAAADAAFIDQLQQLAAQSQRVCSVCSGAIILAAAGLLDGRRAVTHWEDCAYLAEHYPAVTVEVDPIFVQDGHVWTSAGITAGIDMALAVIEADLGRSAAIAMARSLVTPMVRSGGQSQFSSELDRQARDAEGQFAKLHRWLGENIHRIIAVEDMADECGMSSRNFSRRYTEVMGISPAKGLEILRIERARTLLEASERSIKDIAGLCGFGDDERMRRAFLRHVHTAPSDYRRQFR